MSAHPLNRLLRWRALGASLTAAFLLTTAAVAQYFDYTLAPSVDWGGGTPNPIIALNAQGQPTPAMSAVSRFLHGSWHTAMGQTVKFTLTMPTAGKVGLTVTGISGDGPNTIAVSDGATLIGTHSFAGAESWDVPLSAGNHTVTFSNTGTDWINVSAYYFRYAPPPVPGAVTSFSWQQPSVPVYAKAEATIQLSKTYSNPYDPAVISVDALVTAPDNTQYTIPAFWIETVTWQSAALGAWSNFNAPIAGSGHWAVRLAPESVGTWSVVIRVTDTLGTTTSGPSTFTATAAAAPGFVRLDPADRQGYRFDNGRPYLPRGFNLCWQDGSNGTFFDNYMDQMGANGVNWTRYWMTPFARQSIEWSDDHWFTPYAGLGRYSQEASALLDYVLQKAETDGIYLQLVLEHHGLYSTTVDAQWSENPYGTAKPGGWLTAPGQFFTDAAAIAQAQKKYRYIVARWGYSTHILAWELFNEANFTGGSNAAVANWHKTMSTYLKGIDPYSHLVTTSTALAQLDLIGAHADMDVFQEHIYADPIATSLATLDNDLLAHFTKPVLVGEFGSGTSYDGGNHPDNWGDHVRQSSWIGSMKRVPNMFWFWDTYIQAKNLYSVYRPLAQFWGGEDPGIQSGITTAALAVQRSGATVASLEPYGLTSATGCYAYIRDTSYGQWAATASPVTGASLVVTGLAAGNWQATFVDPVTGTSTAGPVVTASGVTTAIPLPTFTKDLAVKLRPTSVHETYAQWQARLFTPAEILAGISAPAVSLSLDGTPNLLHFALGSVFPRQPIPAARLPVFAVAGDQATLAFPSAAGGVAYIVERSTDLQTWTTAQRIDNPVTTSTTVQLGSTAGVSRLFARLRVEER